MILRYEPVSEYHYGFLYDLLKERPKNANISHQKMPSFNEHVAYVDSWATRFREWHVICLGDAMVGSTYLTHHNEFGMFIMRKYAGRGIARETFRWIERRHKGERLLSNVNPKNKRIIGLLESLGCKVIQHTYEHRSR